LEQLTVGKVEMFAAYPIGGGERLLIHVFALPAFIKSAPTNRDLLGYMEALSPPALGTVLDAGRYDDGSQAYVVTKFPRDLSALTKWVEAYKSLERNKHDTTTDVTAVTLWDQGQEGQTQRIPIPVAAKPAGDFTRAFQTLSPNQPEAPKSENDQFQNSTLVPDSRPTQEFSVERSQPTPLSGSLTEQFMAGLGEGTRLTGTPQPITTSPRSETSFGSPDPHLSGNSSAEHSISNREVEPAPNDGRPGEFTTFFKSPLAPQPMSPESLVEEGRYSSPPSGSSKGEFTQLFGAATVTEPNSQEPGPLLEPASQGAGFTNVFGKATSQRSDLGPGSPMGHPSSDAEPASAYVLSSKIDPDPVQFAKPATEPVSGKNGSFGNPIPWESRDENATRLFPPPVQAPTPHPPSALAPGESEYTRIISPRSKPTEAVEKAAIQPVQGGANIKIPIQVSLPPIPSVQAPAPHIPSPQSPPLPSASVQMPPVPPVAIPPVAKGGKKPRGWTAYVPLIVILNLILLAAVGLVLYFVLQQ